MIELFDYMLLLCINLLTLYFFCDLLSLCINLIIYSRIIQHRWMLGYNRTLRVRLVATSRSIVHLSGPPAVTFKYIYTTVRLIAFFLHKGIIQLHLVRHHLIQLIHFYISEFNFESYSTLLSTKF